ncbi:FAD-binding oxidoreductase [Paenibacillus periandrae]|uniref:FAD-binding oxidoreductase n=1 Tax=Paenibacillus periandrae TaxID=1761741 RepID=UPI001F09E0BF|nr:FAD-binding oxidoreductase [Paenibacillus periandrae]
MDGTKAKLENGLISSTLERIVSGNNILPGDNNRSEYRINACLKTLPENEKQVAEILCFADEHRLSVAPQGGGTKDAYGQSTKSIDLVLSLKAMSGVLEHSAGDLMVTVLAGTTLRELQAALKTAGQFLPLDVAWDDQSTIGGIVNSGASGPRRAGYGSVRDFLIASRIVYPNGQVIRTGAKVVKNVAGYDMNKLFIGSMGTLGVHTEFTFKIRPIPAGQCLMVIGNAHVETLRAFQNVLLDSHLEPCVFEWVNKDTVKCIGIETQGPAVFLGFADVWPSVDEQFRHVQQLCQELGATVMTELRGAEEFESALSVVRNILPNSNLIEDHESVVSMKMMGKLTDVQAMYEAAEARAAQYGFSLKFSGGALSGIARATVKTAGEDKADIYGSLTAWIRNLQSDMRHIGVRTVVDFAPGSIRNQISIWDETTTDQTIMRGIKMTIDPNEILNPGRIMGGL